MQRRCSCELGDVIAVRRDRCAGFARGTRKPSNHLREKSAFLAEPSAVTSSGFSRNVHQGARPQAAENWLDLSINSDPAAIEQLLKMAYLDASPWPAVKPSSTAQRSRKKAKGFHHGRRH